MKDGFCAVTCTAFPSLSVRTMGERSEDRPCSSLQGDEFSERIRLLPGIQGVAPASFESQISERRLLRPILHRGSTCRRVCWETSLLWLTALARIEFFRFSRSFCSSFIAGISQDGGSRFFKHVG